VSNINLISPYKTPTTFLMYVHSFPLPHSLSTYICIHQQGPDRNGGKKWNKCVEK
ncbi:hypothetical protein JOQ06_022481, partial [Pogonophryne albipinna]